MNKHIIPSIVKRIWDPNRRHSASFPQISEERREWADRYSTSVQRNLILGSFAFCQCPIWCRAVRQFWDPKHQLYVFFWGEDVNKPINNLPVSDKIRYSDHQHSRHISGSSRGWDLNYLHSLYFRYQISEERMWMNRSIICPCLTNSDTRIISIFPGFRVETQIIRILCVFLPRFWGEDVINVGTTAIGSRKSRCSHFGISLH